MLIWIRRTLTTLLTAVAFWNSYTHTADWFADHGQNAQAGWLALIPEVGVILVVLTLAAGKLSQSDKWIVGSIGIGSVALTLTANLAGSTPGMGVPAALVAPVFAVLGFALEATNFRTAPTTRPQPKKPATSRRKPQGRSLTDEGILWATTLSEWPTRKQIMEQFPAISATTAGKIRAARPKVEVQS